MTALATVVDLDGPTVDSWPSSYEIVTRMIAKFGPDKPHQRELLIRKQWGEISDKSFAGVFPDADPQEVKDYWLSSINKREEPYPFSLVEDAQETLQLLRQNGLVTGLATNRRAKHLLVDMPPALDLAATFDIVQTFGVAGKPDPAVPHPCHLVTFVAKPDPAALDPIVQMLHEKFGIEPHEIVYVGDTIIDLRTARGRGLHFVGVLTGPVNIRAYWKTWAREYGIPFSGRNVIRSVKYLPTWLAKHGVTITKTAP